MTSVQVIYKYQRKYLFSLKLYNFKKKRTSVQVINKNLKYIFVFFLIG